MFVINTSKMPFSLKVDSIFGLALFQMKYQKDIHACMEEEEEKKSLLNKALVIY